MCSTNATNIKSITSHSDPSSFIYSDHKIITATIEVYEDDSFIVGKQSRWKTNELVPRFANMLIKNEIEKIDVNAQTRLQYQHQVLVEWKKRTIQIYHLRQDMYNFSLSDDTRFTAFKNAITLLESCINIALTDNVGTTKPQPAISNEELREIYQEQLNGNELLANRMINDLKNKSIDRWADKINSMTSSEVHKYVSNNCKKIRRKNTGPDPNKIESYREDWREKWLAVDSIDRHSIIGYLPKFEGTTPDYATIELLEAILSKLPNNKSAGPSKIPYEAYKYIGEVMIIELHGLLQDVFKTGMLPEQWSLNAEIPVYKRGNVNSFKDSHRPLGMSECLKKIFEAFFKPAVPDLFKTEPDQYGFKKHHSCADAACDLNEKMNFLKEKGLLKDYTLKKLDNKSAFDRVCHKAIKSFLALHIRNPHYKIILFQLF